MPKEAAFWYRWEGTDLIVDVRVQPRASRTECCGVQQDRLRIRLNAPPVDGKANKQLCHYIADLYGVPKSKVILLQGETHRDKRLRIKNPQQLPFGIERWDDV